MNGSTLSVVASTFAGASLAYLGTHVTGQELLANWKQMLLGAAFAGAVAVVHLYQLPPGSKSAGVS